MEPQKILLVRLDYIGDVVMTTPAFSLIRNQYPSSKISLLTNSVSAQLLRSNTEIDRTYTFNWPWGHMRKNTGFTVSRIRTLIHLIAELRREKFDLVVDFRGDIRFLLLFGVFIGAKVKLSNSRCGNSYIPDHTSEYDVSKHEVERTQDVIRSIVQTESYNSPRLQIDSLHECDAAKLVQSVVDQPFVGKSTIVVAPFSSKDIKAWPESYFREVISYLSHHYTVLIVGTAEDEVAAERLAAQCGEGVYSIAGKTTIIDLAAITKMCRFVIGVDTGVLHIASCFPTTIIAIFGPTRSIEYKPYSPNCIVIENTECVCDQFTHAKCDVMRGEYARCMYDLKPDRIIQVLSKVISASK